MSVDDIPDGYKQVDSSPYESCDRIKHTVTYKKINDKCEIVRTNNRKEYQSRISPIPNKPITAIKKSKPRINSGLPKVKRN